MHALLQHFFRSLRVLLRVERWWWRLVSRCAHNVRTWTHKCAPTYIQNVCARVCACMFRLSWSFFMHACLTYIYLCNASTWGHDEIAWYVNIDWATRRAANWLLQLGSAPVCPRSIHMRRRFRRSFMTWRGVCAYACVRCENVYVNVYSTFVSVCAMCTSISACQYACVWVFWIVCMYMRAVCSRTWACDGTRWTLMFWWTVYMHI